MSEKPSKDRQIEILLGDDPVGELRKFFPGVRGYADALESLSITTMDAYDYFRRHREKTESYAIRHSGNPPTHDQCALVSRAGRWAVGFMEQGVMTEPLVFSDVVEAVTEHFRLTRLGPLHGQPGVGYGPRTSLVRG